MTLNFAIRTRRAIALTFAIVVMGMCNGCNHKNENVKKPAEEGSTPDVTLYVQTDRDVDATPIGLVGSWLRALDGSQQVDGVTSQPGDCGLYSPGAVRVVADAEQTSAFQVLDSSGRPVTYLNNVAAYIYRLDKDGNQIDPPRFFRTEDEAVLFTRAPFGSNPLRNPNFHVFFGRHRHASDPSYGTPNGTTDLSLGWSITTFSCWPDSNYAREHEWCPCFDALHPYGVVFTENCTIMTRVLIDKVKKATTCPSIGTWPDSYMTNHATAHELVHQLGLVPEGKHTGAGGGCHDLDSSGAQRCECLMNWVNTNDFLNRANSTSCSDIAQLAMEHVATLCIGIEHANTGCTMDDLEHSAQP